MTTTQNTELKTTATRIATQIVAAVEDGDGSPIVWADCAVRELATTLLAIRETEWSRKLLSQMPHSYRARVIAVGRELKAG